MVFTSEGIMKSLKFKKSNKVMKGFRLDIELVKKLEEIAAKNNVTLSKVVSTILLERIKD